MVRHRSARSPFVRRMASPQYGLRDRYRNKMKEKKGTYDKAKY